VGVKPATSGFEISFPTQNGREYQVQTRDQLSAGTWADLPDGKRTGNGTTQTVTDPSVVSRRFYRVEISKP